VAPLKKERRWPKVAETAERRPLYSLFRVIDDTLEEIGIPGPFDIIPTPSEVIHSWGLPTLNDVAESLKARVHAELAARAPFALRK